MAALARDKKRQETGVPFVLLPRLGEAVVREDVPGGWWREVLAEIMSADDPAGTGAGSNTDLLFDGAGVWRKPRSWGNKAKRMTEAKTISYAAHRAR